MDKEKVNDVLKMNRLNYALQMSIIFLIFVVFIRPLNFGEDELILKLGKFAVSAVFLIYGFYISVLMMVNIYYSMFKFDSNGSITFKFKFSGVLFAFAMIIMGLTSVAYFYYILTDREDCADFFFNFGISSMIFILCTTPGSDEEQQEQIKQNYKQFIK